MKNYILLDENLNQLDTVLAEDKKQAQQEFELKGWVCGAISTYQEYLDMLRDEFELNSLENQSLEC